MDLDLSGIERFRDSAVEHYAAAMMTDTGPARVVAGGWGKLMFVLTFDEDGHIEASLSHAERLTMGHIDAFCARLGQPVPEQVETIRQGKGVKWILRKGVSHA